MKKILSLIAFSVLMSIMQGVSQEAYAETITFNFEGIVSSVSDVGNVLGGAVMVGDSLTGSYSFDSLTPDTNPGNTGAGAYLPSGLSFEVGSITYVSDPPLDISTDLIFVTDQIVQDVYQVQFRSMQQTSGPALDPSMDVFFVQLLDNDGTFHPDDSLPLSPPPLDPYEVKRAILRTDDSSIVILAPLSSLTLQTDDTVVGGEFLSIDSTALILAGAQSFSWMIPVVLSVLGIGLFVVSRKSENS